MCRAVQQLEQMAADTRALEEKKVFAERLLRRGKMSLEEIAEDSGLTVEDVEKIDRRRSD